MTSRAIADLAVNIAASPPPSEWRSRPIDTWRGRDWSAAWREAQAETAEDSRLYHAVRRWAALLSGDPASGEFWAGGSVPERREVKRAYGRAEFLACPGQPELTTPHHSSQPNCDGWWPRSVRWDERPPASVHNNEELAARPQDRECVAYVIGIGELSTRGAGRGDAWGFPMDAARRGCRVHAYDPTIAIRRRQEESALKRDAHLREVKSGARGGSLRFHFAGLGSGSMRNTTNSYGTIDASVLRSLVQMAAALPASERKPRVLSIDCEGCEWAAFEQMTRDPAAIRILRGVELLFLDGHLSPTMVPPTLKQFVGAFELLFVRLGFRLRWLRSVNGYPADQKVVDFLGVAGLAPGFCCYEMALVREGTAALERNVTLRGPQLHHVRGRGGAPGGTTSV
jgi:hypothetical protein